jgi:predicted dehydrogenase/nucleoside-diphosphate-sugar epimerase
VVGAGYIADYHIAILRALGAIEIIGVCDPNRRRLDSCLARWGIPYGAGSLDELLRDRKPQVVHVLVPPPQHFDVAALALEAGVHVFLEKPMALRSDECVRLTDLARSRGIHVGVNHNANYHPLYRRLLRDVANRELGAVEHVVSFNNLPLPQLTGGDHDHWMFRRPENVLFELGPHPLSQVCGLLGPVRRATTTVTGARPLRNGTTFRDAWQLFLECERGTADVFLSFGRSFPETWMHVVGQDGAVRIDLLNDAYVLDRRTKYVDPIDNLLRRMSHARQTGWSGIRRITEYGLATLRLTGRTDSYFESMKESTAAFYRRLAGVESDQGPAASGPTVIAGLELATAAWSGRAVAGDRPADANGKAFRSAHLTPAAASGGPSLSGDGGREVLVIGGTGFIGRRLVRVLTGAGYPVRLMSRRPALVRADVTMGGGIHVVSGDVRDPDDIDRAVRGCRSVIHLVAGAPTNWAEFEELFIAGTRHTAEACLRREVPELLFASTIAVYDLGRRGVTVTEETSVDPLPGRRNLYSRAKIGCEHLLMDLHRSRGLPVTIFRPGVVVGPGGPVEHLGVGYWPSPDHCITWGRGRNPIPFVLADDVAAALVAAVGRTELAGRSFNLVGDVRLTALEYLDALRTCSARDIRVHRQSIAKWLTVDLVKWAIKAVAGKPNNEFPSYRDLASRTSASQFDCTAAKRDLGWRPVADREQFIELAIRRALQADADL